MSKNKNKKGKAPTKVDEKKKAVKSNFSLNNLSSKNLWIFTVLLTIVYFVASTFSDGFFMHDEPELFIKAKACWSNPVATLLKFQKLGYILFLGIPSLLGFSFLHFTNSLLCSITVMYAYKIVKKIGGGNPFLIYFLLGIQPLWFMLAFRNYTEFLIAFLLVMSVWNHFNKKYIFAALLLSYAAFTRQELHLLLGGYFIILILKKQWLPALLTSTFTVLHNLVGFIITDDILYLPNRIMEYSERMSGGTYPKRGFNHYFEMSNIVFGSITSTLFVAYLSIKTLKKEKPLWIILIPIIGLFLFYCLLNLQSFEFGPGNGGNLRYLLPLSPFIAIIAALSIDEIIGFEKKYMLLIFLIPYTFFVLVYQSYDHDFMKLLVDGENYWIPLILTIGVVAILLLPFKPKQYLLSIATLSIVLVISSARTFNLNNEDATMKKACKWYAQQIRKSKKAGNDALFTENTKVTCNHVLFPYFLDKPEGSFLPIRKTITDTLSKGDLVIWESHYGYRPKLFPGSQPYDDFDKNPNYQKIQYYQSKDRRFMVVFFRKLAD
jgi:hypothetical protein